MPSHPPARTRPPLPRSQKPRSPLRWLALVLALAGCAAPYATPEVQTATRAPGVLELLGQDGPPAPAILSEPARPGPAPLVGRLVATHGMCSHNHTRAGWADLRRDDYAAALGATGFTPLTPTLPEGGPPRVHMDRYRLHRPGGDVELVLLRWGSHVDAARASLDYDNHRAGPDAPEADPEVGAHPQRGRFMADIRAELMNRCLIDAVVYGGSAGDPIRDGMRRALCTALGGQPGATLGGTPGAPAARLVCRIGRTAPVPTVLLPESLGATILFEAFNALDRSAPLSAALSDVRGIYLLSNQYPLLSLANPADPGTPGFATAAAARAPGAGPIVTFLDRYAPAAGLRIAETGTPDPGVALVAISDPNDVLSYRIHPRQMQGQARVANVLVSNTATVLGLFANPARAHSGYRRAQVFTVIAGGWPPRAPD